MLRKINPRNETNTIKLPLMLTAGILHYRACNSEELNEGMNMAENNLGSVSHKGEKVRSFSAALKLEVIRYAEVNSNHAAS